MAHRTTDPYDRRRVTRFAINFRAFIFDFSVTITLITAGQIPVRNERLTFCIFTVSGKITAIISLVIALIIRVASALVKRALFFLQMLLIAVLI